MPLLEARAVSRRFGSFTALDQVDFSLQPGEIHALLGENGAGKSTLMNLLSGLLRPSAGTILMDGEPVRFASPADAAACGIGMVHQHFLLVPPLSVAENLLLSADRGKGGPLSWPIQRVLAEAKALAERLGWTIPWEQPAGNLPVGTQQRVEILKALRGQTRVLIFDEPTAVLTPTETPELFATLRALAAEGKGIVFISHKLDEVMALAERVTVLRRGKVVAQLKTSESDVAQLATAMVGSALPVATQRPERPKASEPVVAVAGLTVRHHGQAKPALDQVSFTVSPGEILGFAGVDGNGQTELSDCLTGFLCPSSGTITVSGEPLAPNIAAVRRARFGIIPADRQKRGLALGMSVQENLTLGVQDKAAFRSGPFLKASALRQRTSDLIQQFDIRTTGPEALVSSLSGGNQQKVVIARALANEPRVLVAVNPTRGLDVGAISAVHTALRQAQATGAAVVLISTELDEVLTLSDRVAVLFEGKLMGIVSPETPRERLGQLMGGIG